MKETVIEAEPVEDSEDEDSEEEEPEIKREVVYECGDKLAELSLKDLNQTPI